MARLALAAALIAIYSTLGVVRDVTDWLRERDLLTLSVTLAFAACALAAGWLAARSERPRAAFVTLALACPIYVLAQQLMTTPEERLHLLEYGVVALLARAALPEGLAHRNAWALAVVVAAGWVDEGIQALLPSRHYDLRDVAFNAVAGALALGSLVVYRALPIRRARTERR